jgi:hypothetical protein
MRCLGSLALARAAHLIASSVGSSRAFGVAKRTAASAQAVQFARWWYMVAVFTPSVRLR